MRLYIGVDFQYINFFTIFAFLFYYFMILFVETLQIFHFYNPFITFIFNNLIYILIE